MVPTAAPPLLIVTLDAEASACVREFAKTFGYEPCDVTSGIVMDELPQALQEWDDCRTGKGGEYFIGCIEKTVEARTRRRAASRLADGPSYTRREIALALCAFGDDCRRMGWMQADMRFSEAAAQIAEHGLPEIIIGEKGIRMKTPMRKD